jgi:malonate-semialdehyde dehydrogenase (acetylating)/methylmalonate-semialdehyde dehydrogenase
MEKNMTTVPRLKYFVDGQWRVSQTERYMDVYNPSTGEVMAQAPAAPSKKCWMPLPRRAKPSGVVRYAGH